MQEAVAADCVGLQRALTAALAACSKAVMRGARPERAQQPGMQDTRWRGHPQPAHADGGEQPAALPEWAHLARWDQRAAAAKHPGAADPAGTLSGCL
jgi:hypothetical protein